MAINTESFPDANVPPMVQADEMAAPMQQSESVIRLLEIQRARRNVCDLLEDSELITIGQRCVSEYKTDLESRSEWQRDVEEGIKLAKQVREEKTFPWPGAANVKYPLLAEAAISFAARAYPELVKGRVVQTQVIGKDPDGSKQKRAERVSAFMSWQVMSDMPYWDSETDLLLVQLPLIGNAFRKTYHDPVKGTCESRLVPAMDFVVNHGLKCLEDARRESEYLELSGNGVLERQRSGRWRTVELTADKKDDTPQDEKVYKFIEQHRWLDLDKDGYEEPYVVTVHIETGTVMRIVPRFTSDDVILNELNQVVRIEAARHYTHYTFMPNPDGGLYAMGLCMLLLPISESINTVLNQLLDAGTMANTSGGFISKGIRIKGGTFRLKPNEWTFADSTGQQLRDAIVPIPVKEPSVVLFQLLGLLIEAGKGLGNLKDVLSGNLPTTNTPATTVLALIEQGQKVFNAIYKRIWRSMGVEFKAIFRENMIYLKDEKYTEVIDEQASVKQDFNPKDYDVCPTADPTVSSQVQRMARAQALMQVKGEPGMNQDAINIEFLESIGIDAPERFYNPMAQQQAMEQQSALAQVAAEQKLMETRQKMEKTQAEIKKIHADALQSLAKAEEIGAKVTPEQALADMAALALQLQQLTKENDSGSTAESGMAGMGQPPGNEMVPQGPPIGGGIPPAVDSGGGNFAPVV